jgi:homoserine O-acetyltransferase/O-succinyltransferase
MSEVMFMPIRRLACTLLLLAVATAAAEYPAPTAGDFVVRNWHFKSGETLAEVRLHYYMLGTPARDASGRVTNAVLILHGTGGSGRGFLTATYAGMLFGAGQLLDATKYFIILPDNIGHGQSSKPSDGLRMRFPHYDYDDMVALQHELLTRGLNVNHLRLVMGTSMGAMHTWVWGETYPDFMDALMPLAALPVEIAGRNRIWRRAMLDAIRNDPAWNNGEYTQQPPGLRIATEFESAVAGSALQMQKQAPTREAAEKLLEQGTDRRINGVDANNFIYFFEASRNYNPAPKLETIQAPLLAINSADDFINPPELGILEREIKRVKRGRAIVLPISGQTRGHGTHSLPLVWQSYLAKLLRESGGLAPGTGVVTVGPNLPPFTPTLGGPPMDGGNGGVYRVGNGVTAPRKISGDQPSYTDYARSHHISGDVLLWAIVWADGSVKAIRVQRGVEPSLDQSAVETVRTWRFEPAMKDGQPVAVQLNIEVTFRLQ